MSSFDSSKEFFKAVASAFLAFHVLYLSIITLSILGAILEFYNHCKAEILSKSCKQTFQRNLTRQSFGKPRAHQHM